MQQRGGERGGAAPHGDADLLCHGVPGEKKLYTQVSVETFPFLYLAHFHCQTFVRLPDYDAEQPEYETRGKKLLFLSSLHS